MVILNNLLDMTWNFIKSIGLITFNFNEYLDIEILIFFDIQVIKT